MGYLSCFADILVGGIWAICLVHGFDCGGILTLCVSTDIMVGGM